MVARVFKTLADVVGWAALSLFFGATIVGYGGTMVVGVVWGLFYGDIELGFKSLATWATVCLLTGIFVGRFHELNGRVWLGPLIVTGITLGAYSFHVHRGEGFQPWFTMGFWWFVFYTVPFLALPALLSRPIFQRRRAA